MKLKTLQTCLTHKCLAVSTGRVVLQAILSGSIYSPSLDVGLLSGSWLLLHKHTKAVKVPENGATEPSQRHQMYDSVFTFTYICKYVPS